MYVFKHCRQHNTARPFNNIVMFKEQGFVVTGIIYNS